MARHLTHKAAHTYGVLDPLMVERNDTKFVQGSLADALNCICLPQGGYTERGGTDHITVTRRTPAAVAITSGMITNANGGVKANLIDGDPAVTFVTAAVAADPFVLFTVDYGAPVDISHIDILGFKAELLDRDNCLKVQYHNGVTFVDFAPAVHLRKKERNRRFARAPMLGNLSLQQWRLVVTGGAGVGTITIGEIKSWSETAALSAQTTTRRYNYSVDRYYTLVLSAGNCDVFRLGVWLAACSMESTGTMIREIKHLPSDDTILFFHQDMAPQAIVRQGSDNEWQWGRQAFQNIPLADLGGVYTNGVNEKQTVRLFGATGNTFDLQVEGETTTAFALNATGSVTAAAIKAALEALANVDAGLTVTALSSATEFRVEFSGGSNAGKNWGEMTGRGLSAVGDSVLVRTEQKGIPAGEPIMSDSAGWPAVGRFAQQRLILAGFRSRPKSWLMSVAGEPFNLESTREGADAGRVYDLDDDDTNVIRDIHVGSTIQFFLDGSVWSLPKENLDAEKVPRSVKSDAPGIDRKVRPISIDNALFYPQRGGNTLRSMVFSELEQNFLADNASVLSAFLYSQPVDSALRRSTKGNDADLLFVPRADGGMTTITLMRAQEVSGFMPHLTMSGKFLSVSIDANEDVWFICERTVDGVIRHCLEKMQPEKLLDGAIDVALGAPSATVTGLAKFNGQTVHVIGDGDYVGAFPVAGGQVTLPQQLQATARAGHWTAPLATDVPFRPEEEDGRPIARQKRVYAAEISLYKTTSVAIAANGGETENVPLLDMDNQPMDTPLSALPFTGRRRIEGMPGFTETAQFTITQVFPGRLTVRAVNKEIAA